MTVRSRAPAPVPISTTKKSGATTRLHRIERLLITTFSGHVSIKVTDQVIQDVRREVPIDMPEESRPSIWVVDALQVTSFDGQGIRNPGSDLLGIIRDRIAPHVILLRVESTTNTESSGQAAVILFARGICFGNGVKLHILGSEAEVQPYVENLRKEGVLLR
ncbi:hypothetical protein IPH19_00430 [Candidatus Uhrbacteria bacterium]|nr:MAG: hypothetical protein IPH19_00430 [Candidatus Uhrbacteria bacterium]